MTSKEALKDIFDILINLERFSNIHDEQNIKKQKFDIVEKDLETLEEHRKIEEELGINLITLFKALKGIWVKSTNGDAYYVGSPYLCFSENEKRELEFQFRVGGTWYKIKDRGKTWALDKKEFYKNIK